jgi:Flp pilus assembly protein TadD
VNKRRLLGHSAAFLAAVATLCVYLPALQNDFVYWDDDRYVIKNHRITSLGPDLFKWAFLESRETLWHPLTWLSHALDYAAWGLNPWGHHLTSIVLHALNTLLVYFVISSLLKADNREKHPAGQGQIITAAAAAFLFGLHPLHVESVAWVSERKDVLSAFFSLAALYAYLSYADVTGRRGSRSWRVRRYILSLGLFTLALLSKPIVVTLPLVMLIIDWYPLGRCADRKAAKLALLEKIPFFAFSLATVVIMVIVGGVSNFELVARPAITAPLAKVLVASRSITFYLEKMVWPAGLSPLYPYPQDAALAHPQYWGSVVLVVATTAGIYKMAPRCKIFVAAWASYLVTLLPVLGVIQIGPHAAANRYAYLSSVPIFLVCGLACSWCWERISTARHLRTEFRAAAVVGCLAALCGLSWLTLRQIATWSDTETLFKHAIAVTRDNWLMRKELGVFFALNGRYAEAIDHLGEALRLRPSYAEVHANLGYALLAAGRIEEAESRLHQALALDRGHLRARLDLGSALERGGKVAEAQTQLEEALRLAPLSDEARFRLAGFHSRQGDIDAVERHLAGHPEARSRLADLLASQGRSDEAEHHYREALRLQPDDPETCNGLGVVLARRGDFEGAAAAFSRAVAMRAGFAEAHYNLGKVLDREGKTVEAIEHYRKAIASDPTLSEARNNLGVDLILMGAPEQGLAEIREAIRLDPDNRDARANLETYLKKTFR